MSQRAKFHHRHHGRPLKERCHQVGCSGELREARARFGFPEFPVNADGTQTRAARRAPAAPKLGLPGCCAKCGTHVNIRSIMGISIEHAEPADTDGSAIETVTAAEQDELLRAYQEEAVA